MRDRIVREAECRELTGLSAGVRQGLEAAGAFPKRRRLSVRVSGWLESELLVWLHSRPSDDAATPRGEVRPRGRPGAREQ
jgi:prophage regulatory protein